MTDEIDDKLENEHEASEPELAPVEEKPPQKMYSQEHVERVIKKRRDKAFNEGYKKAVSDQQQMQPQEQQQPVAQPQQQIPVQSFGGITPDQFRQIAAEEVAKAHQHTLDQIENNRMQAEGQRVVNEFATKLSVGKSRYEDFDDKIKMLDLKSLPGSIIHLSNLYDNTAEIMYEFASNPNKLASMQVLAHTNPQLAVAEMKKLSDSIKTNDAAKSMQAMQSNVRSPLSQQQPSVTQTDSGVKTVSDLRKSSGLRG